MLAAVCVLANISACIPARWPSGNPESLNLLQGAAVNALLLEPPAWNPRFLKRAATMSVATLGVIHSSPKALSQARRAEGLGLNALVLDGNFDKSFRDTLRSGIPVIELPSRQQIQLNASIPIAGTSQALWPGIEIEHNGKVSTGPSSAPWIDTNTGFLRFLSAATSAPIWLGERPPPGNVFPVERYLLAVADAAIVNAHWIVALDDDLQKRLFAREPRAMEAWQKINAYLRYFEDHPWRSYTQFGEFAVIEDASSGGLLSAGVLDMLSVLHKSARPVPTRLLNEQALAEAKIALNIDAATLEQAQQQALKKFASDGGKILNPPSGWSFPPPLQDQITPTRQQVEAIQPIWEITYNATLRRNFGARTFNTSTIIFTLTASPNRKHLLLHLLNYADYVSEDVAVQVTGNWKKARLYVPGEPPQDLTVYPVPDGTGVDVSKIVILGSLLFE